MMFLYAGICLKYRKKFSVGANFVFSFQKYVILTVLAILMTIFIVVFKFCLFFCLFHFFSSPLRLSRIKTEMQTLIEVGF